MIAHVAEAGEDRGRVVLRLCSGRPHPVAIEAAIRIAKAYRSGIESLFVEDAELIGLTGLPFVREISLSGRSSRPLSLADIESQFKAAFADARRQIEALAKSADVPLIQRMVRDEPIRAVQAACEACGPWNVVALADPLAGGTSQVLGRLLDALSAATGLVAVGPRAKRVSGPILIALERSERLAGMLKVAERLAASEDAGIVLLVLAAGTDEREWLEGEARLAVGEHPNVRFSTGELEAAEPAAAARLVAGEQAGFVLAEYGGLLVPEAGDLGPLLHALECPLFLIK